MKTANKKSCIRARRKGLSLIEVILALAILGIALAIIGEILRQGFISASEARWRSEAQLLCDSKMAEVAAGVLPLESSSMTSIEQNPDWEYQIEVTNAEMDGLLRVQVTVQQAAVDTNPLIFRVTRFMPDPDYDPQELQQ